MFEVLNSYLFQHKSISIPGLGTIYMEMLPASIDSSTKNILPPLFYFRFDKYFDAPDKEFFSYLGTQQNMADYEAIRWYTEFSFELREKINLHGKMEWVGVGELKKDDEGNVVFESSLGNPSFLQPVSARKVIHPDAKHVLLVGDTERTNFEMNEWLQHDSEKDKKDRWWLYALIIGAIALLILIFHFSSHPWQGESLGNQQLLKVEK
jgi:CCDC81-like prokaryotic HU domain 1